MKKLRLLVLLLIKGFSAFAQTTYYSFQSGDLNAPDIWTTDPSGTLLLGSATPGATDYIVILNGRTITISANNKTFASVTIQQGATLAIGTTTGHNFTTVTGSGTFRLESATIPVGNFTSFYSATGGTMEFSGSGTFNLPNLGTIRNLTISGTGVKGIANNLTLHQDLRINSGTLRIGNNNTARTVIINGDVYVESGAVWDILNINNPLHTVNVYGSIFNNGGTIDFINSGLNYTGDPANGSAVLNMLGTSNEQIVANGVVELNRLIINKGTDKTFVVHITSNTKGNFRLYGRNNQANGSTSSPYSPENPEIFKALWIRNGTLRLGLNVDIESLTEGGNDFFIPENAQLWVDGAEVYTTTTNNGSSNQGLTVYGTFRITDGLFDTRNSAGFVYRKSGVFIVDGGNCRVSQVRRSGSSPANNFTSYIQSGGIVTVDGVGENSNAVGRFSLDKPESVFRMSGGTLRVSNNNGAAIGGLDIKSDPINASVTGGTIEITTTGSAFEFFSSVPVYNLNVIHGGNNFTLQGNLDIENDLTIGIGNTFLTNNYTISIGGDFTNSGTFTAGTSTITVNGSRNSNLSFNSVGTQVINNLTIAKDDASLDTVFITNGATTPFRVTGEFRVESGVVDYDNFTLNAQGNVYIASRVGLAGTTGQLLLDGSTSQTITIPVSGNGASVGRLRLNNAADFVLTGNTLTVDDELALDAGVFNIGIYGLNIYGSLTTTSVFGVNEMIQTAGNASDGGLGLYINANDTYTFPIGLANKYTPASAVITNYTDDGLLRINPVDGELQTLVRPDGNALTYYFRTRTADFTTLPDVSYTFTYNAADVPGGDDPNNDYVSGKVENATRTSYGAAGANVTATTFTIPTETLTQASYTAALASKFSGSVPIFYSRGNMNAPVNWNDASNWSNESHTGSAAATPPTAGSIVQIGYGGTGNMHSAGGNTHWITIDVNNINVAEVRFLWTPGIWRPRLRIPSGRTNIDLGKVSGQGEMFIINTDTQSPDFIGDFGEFATDDVNNVFNYQLTNDGTITLPTDISVYPTLRLEANTNNTQYNNRIFTSTIDLTVLGGFNIDWGATFRFNNAVGNGDIEVFGNSRLGDGGSSGRLLFPSTGQSRTITYHGDITLNTSGDRHNRIEVDNTTPNGLVHKLRVGGSIIQNSSNSYIDLFTNNTGGNNVELELVDANSGKGYTRTAGAVLDAYRIIMNKGSNTSSDFSMNSSYTLGGTTNTTTKALEIQNGLFIHNTSSSITLSSGGSDFNIPETGGIEIADGTMTITGTAANGILLDGLLRISGGTLTLGDNDATPANDDHYIEYSASGSATIEVSGGTLTVGSQIRRGFLSTTGILTYNQTGGTVTVGRYYAPTNERGIFEIINTGSSFTHTAGSLTIVREQPNANVAGFIFQPQSSTATGDITIGSANTPANHTIDIDASQPIGSLIISDVPTNLTARLLVHDLTVNTNLNIGLGSTFNTNGLDLNIGGAFTNYGTFQGTGSRTTFNGSGAQVATLNAATTFDELEINKTGTLTLAGSQNPDVTTHLLLTSGTIDDGGRIINLQGNMTANSIHTSTGSGRIRFNGSITQEIYGNNNGQLGSIEIDNSSGILLETDLQINGTSTLTNGIFNIQSRLLTFGVNAAIAGTPSASRMFRNDGSLNASGYRKIVGTGASDFTIPMGTTSYYTPARYNFSSNTTQGTITIKPVTLSVNAATGGKNDVLNYHWNVTSTGFTTYTVTQEYTYDDDFVQLNDIATENDYVGSRYFGEVWTTDGTVNSATNVIQFASKSYLDGLYTAGDPNEFGSIPTYYSRTGKANITTTGALWTDADTWSTREWTDPLHNDISSIPAKAPDGNAVQIRSGHIVLVTANSQNASSVLLEGTLDLGTSFSHILGNVSGTGNLIIGSTTVVFPAGNFDAFTGSGGGTVIYNAASDVTLPPQTVYWNLEIAGAYQRTLSDVDITVNNNLLIENTARFNANNRQISLRGNWINNSGNATPFVPGTGTVVLNGTTNQTIGGSASTTFYNLTVNNSQTGNSLTSGITVNGTLNMQSGRMNLNGQTVTIGTSGTLSESPGNLFYGSSGSIVATRTLGTSPGNVAGLGFNITSTAVPLGNTTITRQHSKITAQALNSINRSYVVTPATNTGLNATVVFNYDQTEVDGTHDENTYVLYRKPTAGSWQQRGGSVNTTTNQITLTGIDAFSEWTVDEGNSLPVDLVGLAIQEIRNRPIIKWETASEYENYGFYVERRFLDDSTKADEWTELAFIEGKGTIFERQFYQFQDENVGVSGHYEYRLIQMDFDGKTKTFGPIEFFNRPPDYFMLDQNYPNPFNPVTTIPYQMAKNGKVRIDVFDILGRRVQTLVDSEVKAGNYSISFNASNLASGVYLVRMTTEGFTFTRKIVLVK